MKVWVLVAVWSAWGGPHERGSTAVAFQEFNSIERCVAVRDYLKLYDNTNAHCVEK